MGVLDLALLVAACVARLGVLGLGVVEGQGVALGCGDDLCGAVEEDKVLEVIERGEAEDVDECGEAVLSVWTWFEARQPTTWAAPGRDEDGPLTSLLMRLAGGGGDPPPAPAGAGCLAGVIARCSGVHLAT